MGAVASVLIIAKVCPSLETPETVAYSADVNVVKGPPAIEA
jgi:hypothetical protein